MLEAHGILVVESAELLCLFLGVCAEYRAVILVTLLLSELRESPSGKQVPPVWCGAG